jgi:transposase
LFNATASRFDVIEVSADKGYISNKNLNTVASTGATPYIPFKSNATPGADLWNKMYHYYSFKRPEFLEHYHKRSNVESTFSMIKAKFGGYVRSKTFRAQVNEVLCKVLAHNLCCLVGAMFELGIEPAFLDGPSVA